MIEPGQLVQHIVFYVFSIAAIANALMVILSRNQVHSALFLVATFVASAGLWILLQAEFLGLILIIVYVGAVMTLFLFVVMMLRLEPEPFNKGFVKYLPIAALIALLTMGVMAYVVGPNQFGLMNYPAPLPHGPNYSNIKHLGFVLYTKYAYPFELAAIVLLVALIAAIALAFIGPRNRKGQNPDQQVRVRPQDRIRIVKMPAEKKE